VRAATGCRDIRHLADIDRARTAVAPGVRIRSAPPCGDVARVETSDHSKGIDRLLHCGVMGNRIRATVLALLLGTSGALVAPHAAAAAGCCVRYGYGPWFSGPAQSADCHAYGDAHVGGQWDGYHCVPGTGTRTGQTEVVFYLIIS
jgi:hypothetical protein